LYFLSILKELKVILNKELIEKYTTKEYKFNARDDLAEINRMVKINKDSVQTYREFGDNVPDGIIYSLVLRLRELYLIKCIREGKQYSKKRFLDTVGEKIHSAYARVKRDQQEIDNISPDEAEPIIELSEKWLKELKGRKSQSKA